MVASCCACSSLIAACERASELDQALQLLDSMHAAGFNHTPELYAKLIERWAGVPPLCFAWLICNRGCTNLHG